MKSSRRFSLQQVRSKHWSVILVLALALSPTSTPYFVAQVHAQQQVAPVGSGFVLDAADLRFIYQQILVAQDHAAGGTLLGNGPNQVSDPQLPRGLRTVDGSFNNLVPVPDQHLFGAADRLFPRLTTPLFRDAEAGTSYKQKLLNNVVFDSQPRIVTNTIADQTANNPAAFAVASNPCGFGGFVCSPPATIADVTDPDSGALFIPNITPDFGLSAPFNVMFTFFGQFFDHGLDLVTKGGGTVIIPLQPDDPLFVTGSQTNFMVLTRGQNQPGPDGIIGTADDIQDTINETTPWVDQNQTYTSHPSHQVFLREYALNSLGKPVQTGLMLDGGFCAQRATGIPGDEICNIGNWGEVKAQAATKLGILLTDSDIFNVPLIAADPYGHFKPGPNGFAQLVLPGNVLLEGNPVGGGVPVPETAFRTGHAFLNDIAHNAVPSPGLVPDPDTTVCDFRTVPSCQPPGTYDDELLNAHFITGDGRGNENIALTMVHNLFHAEHNRLRFDINRLINTPGILTADEVAAWKSVHAPSGWDYGERLFQAARFVTEMEYQHLVFEEFARTIQPLINPFLGGLTNIDAAISAEFAHTVYRLGHSMLPERLSRLAADGVTAFDIRLLNAFLNPTEYNRGAGGTPQTADKAAGALIRGLSREIGNELDEFVTSSVRNTLLGLPLDLPAINLARGRSEGIPPLNLARAQFFAATQDPVVQPYANWSEFRFGLRHDQSFANFLAAYGTDPRITSQTTVADKRTAAQNIVLNPADPFLFQAANLSGLNNVDFWIGGMAEKPAVFGGLLGSTFNFVFEKQLEHLQDGDRFYYLQRLDGLNLVVQLEGNSLAELARRNTDLGATMDVIFKAADFNLEASAFATAGPFDLGGGISVFTLADGTKVFFDPLHSGKNIVINGTAGDDRWRSDVGDDTIFGNGGNDRLDGGDGNDTLLGGDGDDVLLGGNGDDVLKGGPGNDAMQSGPGFGGDILIGGSGNDFMVGGDDGVEYFAGPGNDIIVDGAMRAEAILGDAGDDWLDDGEGHDGGMFGDDGNIFDLLAGLTNIGGDDVMGGGPGQDNHFGFGGDDIFLMSEGSNKFFGDHGFDWITLRGWPAPNFIELSLLADPLLNLNFNDLRNVYRFVDGGSGWDLDDHIAGSNNVLCDPPGEVAECLIPGMELTAAGAAKIKGLTDLMGPTAFNKDLFAPAIPGVKGVGFMGGDILLGGKGSDTLEGKLGDDLIDGDAWLNVQLRAVYNDGSVRLVNSPRDLVADVFSDPQRLNPGKITIVKSIVDAVLPNAQRQTVPPADCGAAVPLNCDTAVFAFPRADYTITFNLNGTVTVTHVPSANRDIPFSDGTDTLRNIERALFADGVVADLTGGGVNSVATGTVTISDTTPTEDQVLTATASISDANGFNAAAVVFDWETEATPGVFKVVGTGASFAPDDVTVGHALRVAARFTDNLGFKEALRSDSTAAVTNINDVPAGAPTVSRTDPQEGETITANPATVSDGDGLAGVTFQFQWQQSSVGGGTTFSNIRGATSVAFTPAEAQVNRALRVAVSFVDNHGTGERVVSAATTVVGNVLVGTSGSNLLNGTAGRDSIDGLAGADVILGNAGNDTITGGAGIDTLTGGSGNDVFKFALGSGADIIVDFDADPTGGQDLLDISARGITATTFATKVSITGIIGGTQVTFVGTTDSIRLMNVAPSAVTIADFILAP